VLPIWSTTLTVLRSPQPDDAWPDDESVYTAIATGVRAHLSSPARLVAVAGDQRSEMTVTLLMELLPDDAGGNPQNLTHLDLLRDESYPELAPLRVTWATPRFPGTSLEHWRGEAVRLEFEQQFDQPKES